MLDLPITKRKTLASRLCPRRLLCSIISKLRQRNRKHHSSHGVLPSRGQRLVTINRSRKLTSLCDISSSLKEGTVNRALHITSRIAAQAAVRVLVPPPVVDGSALEDMCLWFSFHHWCLGSVFGSPPAACVVSLYMCT